MLRQLAEFHFFCETPLVAAKPQRKFPIGGIAHERLRAQDPVKLRGRRYSPDRRSTKGYAFR